MGEKVVLNHKRVRNSFSSIDNKLTSLSYEAVESKPYAWDINSRSTKRGRQ